MDRVNFLYFWPNKICVSLTNVVSSFFPPKCSISSGRRCHTAMLCHAYFPWKQDEFTASASSFGNTSSRRLSSRHLPAILRPVASLLEPKPKYWIHTVAAGHPPHTVRLPPSIAIKNHINLCHSPHQSTASLFCPLPSQDTMSSELHPSSLFSFTTVPHQSSLCTMAPMVTN
jgi:hypothetical protein